MLDFFEKLVLYAPFAAVVLILGVALLAAAIVGSFELKGVRFTRRQSLYFTGLGGLLMVTGLGMGLLSLTGPGFLPIQFLPSNPTDGKALEMKAVSSTVFPFAGGDNPQVQGTAKMSVLYDEDAEPNYVLDYSLPALSDWTWAGIGIQFDPLNIAEHNYLELTIQFIDPQTQCQIKHVDASGDSSYFSLGSGLKPNSNVAITVDGDRQNVRIPLRGNFDDVNLEQITELTFITDSNLATGDHSYTVSRIRFVKD